MSEPTPEERARRIDLGHGTHCCDRATGRLCCEHGRIAIAIAAAEECARAREPIPVAESLEAIRQLTEVVKGRALDSVEEVLDCLAVFLSLHPQEAAFIRHLAENRLEGDTAAVFADWLKEHGRTEAGDRVQTLRPQKGDVLALSVDHPVNQAHWQDMEKLTQEVANETQCVAVLLGQGAELRRMDPEDMRQHGWVRVEEADRRVAEERNACALVAETEAESGNNDPYCCDGVAMSIASTIRERGTVAP